MDRREAGVRRGTPARGHRGSADTSDSPLSDIPSRRCGRKSTERLVLVATHELARALLNPSLMKASGSWFGSVGMGFAICGVLAGCAGPAADRVPNPAEAQAAVVATERPTTPAVVASTPTRTIAAPTLPNATKARPSSAAVNMNLKVKRLVITQAVKDREPEALPGALPSDGSAIFAFAEVSNMDGSSGNVRITFERKGGAEKVGDVLLPVPGNVPRYRTWAFTHFIRVPGVWEAVLWSDAGSELGRASFEVAPG